MSGYLTNLATRALNPARTLRPELPSIFAVPKVADDSPFESEILSEAPGPAPRSSAAPGPSSVRSSPPSRVSTETQAIESEMESANNPGNQTSRPANPQTASSTSATPIRQVVRPRSAAPSPFPGPTSETSVERIINTELAPLPTGSQDAAPVELLSRPSAGTRETSTLRVATAREATELEPASRDGKPVSISRPSRLPSTSSRLSKESSLRGPFDHSFSMDGSERNLPLGQATPSTPVHDIAMRVPPSGDARSFNTLKVSASGPSPGSIYAIPKSLTAGVASEIPTQLRSLAHATATAPGSNSRSEQEMGPPIQVTIGRVEVRAPSSQTGARNAPRPSSNGPTLEEYLRIRSQRERV
jgi:hypothetical protein